MKALNSLYYRIDPAVKAHLGQGDCITMCNVEQLLDARAIQERMRNERWWTIRRNGMTQRWIRDPSRIRIPYKFGLYGHGAITERDFVEVAVTTPRVVVDVKCLGCDWDDIFPTQQGG